MYLPVVKGMESMSILIRALVTIHDKSFSNYTR